MKVILNLDDTHESLIRRRMRQLKHENIEQLRDVGQDELAEELEEREEPSIATYVKQAVKHDLRKAGLLDE